MGFYFTYLLKGLLANDEAATLSDVAPLNITWGPGKWWAGTPTALS